MGAIALCSDCRRDTLPQLAQPSWHREKHRASALEREPAPDPRAETIKRRKQARKRASDLRKQIRVAGILQAATFFLSLKARPLPPDIRDENCAKCQEVQLRGQEIERGSR